MTLSPEGIALASAAVAALANVIVAPVATRHGSLVVSAVLSSLLALIFLALSPFVLGTLEPGLHYSRAMLYILLGAAPILAAGTLLYWESVRRLGASIAFPIASSYPLLVSLFGFLALGEPFSAAKLAGTVSIISGVSLISVPASEVRTQSSTRAHWNAVLIGVLATLCWSGNTVLVKLAVDDGLGVFTANLLRMPVIATLLITALATRHEREDFLRMPRRPLFVLVAGAAVGGVQDLLYFYTLQTSDLSTVVPLASTAPLFVLVMAVLFLKERVTLRTCIGTVMTVLGIALLT